MCSTTYFSIFYSLFYLLFIFFHNMFIFQFSTNFSVDRVSCNGVLQSNPQGEMFASISSSLLEKFRFDSSMSGSSLQVRAALLSVYHSVIRHISLSFSAVIAFMIIISAPHRRLVHCSNCNMAYFLIEISGHAI